MFSYGFVRFRTILYAFHICCWGFDLVTKMRLYRPLGEIKISRSLGGEGSLGGGGDAWRMAPGAGGWGKFACAAFRFSLAGRLCASCCPFGRAHGWTFDVGRFWFPAGVLVRVLLALRCCVAWGDGRRRGRARKRSWRGRTPGLRAWDALKPILDIEKRMRPWETTCKNKVCLLLHGCHVLWLFVPLKFSPIKTRLVLTSRYNVVLTTFPHSYLLQTGSKLT